MTVFCVHSVLNQPQTETSGVVRQGRRHGWTVHHVQNHSQLARSLSSGGPPCWASPLVFGLIAHTLGVNQTDYSPRASRIIFIWLCVCVSWQSWRLTGEMHCKKRLMIFPFQPGCHLPNSPWPGKIKLFPARESLVNDIPARDGKTVNFFYSVPTYSSQECTLRKIVTFLYNLKIISNVI